MKNLLFLFSFFGTIFPALGTNPDTINCNCSGQGPITFVFDAGMGNWSIFFKPLASKLTGNIKICLFDRPGYSSPHKVEDKPNALSIAMHMKQVLLKEGVKDSVILVGHSMGGLNVRMFQSLYPEMVKGMILIDAANPDLLEKMPEVKTNIQEQIRQMRKVSRLAKFGLLNFAKSQIPTFGLPKAYLKDYYKIVTKSFYYETYIQELENLSHSIEQCKNLPNLGNLPLLVISSRQGLNSNASEISENSNTDYRWIGLQKELASLSSNSIYLESDEDHFIHLSDTALVVEAIHNFYNFSFK